MVTLELTIDAVVLGGAIMLALWQAVVWTARLRELRWYQGAGVLALDALFIVAAIRVGLTYLAH